MCPRCRRQNPADAADGEHCGTEITGAAAAPPKRATKVEDAGGGGGGRAEFWRPFGGPAAVPSAAPGKRSRMIEADAAEPAPAVADPFRARDPLVSAGGRHAGAGDRAAVPATAAASHPAAAKRSTVDGSPAAAPVIQHRSGSRGMYDENSAGGTFLDENDIRPEKARVRDGDEVRVGQTNFLVKPVDPARQTASWRRKGQVMRATSFRAALLALVALGTSLNGRRLAKNEQPELKVGDRVQFSSALLLEVQRPGVLPAQDAPAATPPSDAQKKKRATIIDQGND